jgi:hypothetical protein
MKWIKLFEEFDSDMLEDAKHIMISHLGELEEIDFIGGDLQVEMSDRLRERIRVYRLLESPNVRDLKACEEHLNDETEGVFWNVNLDWYSGKVAIIGIGESIEEFLGEWLLERFSGLKKQVRELTGDRNQVFYYDKNGSGVFYYYEKRSKLLNSIMKDKSAYVSFQKIWGFFQTVLGLEDSQIKQIVKDWLWDGFGLDLEPKMW